MPAGRPTKYDPDYHPEHAYKLALLSHTDEEIAAFFEIDVVTFYRWQERHDEFRKAVTRGKIPADAEVRRSFHKRACGYDIKTEKIFCFQGEVIRAETDHAHPARSRRSAQLAQEPPARKVARQEAVGARRPGRTRRRLPHRAGLHAQAGGARCGMMPSTGSASQPSPLRQAAHRREAQAARADLRGGPAAGWHGARPVEHEHHGMGRPQGTAEEEAWPLIIVCAATRNLEPGP